MPTVQQVKDAYPTLITGVQSVFSALTPVPDLDIFLQALIDQSYALLSQNFYGNYYEYALTLWIGSRLNNLVISGGSVSGTLQNIAMRRVDGEYEIRYANFLAQTAADHYKNQYDVELDALNKMFDTAFVVM